ncbi:hypothetical protein FDP41_006503 [Naegleria fowleri]|uniref:AAA+ ATPase domain-containing protein n=1 Tax=Naegleria fowleri TaxID=5763 RepID=A0A6A5BJ93_NAEFO|nr:uncharacterized protein FDP41_006503 [Naegleria fowleri]KAF0974471.1 hypothetical protein FDP41_006503 [Naegleria fowleri]
MRRCNHPLHSDTEYLSSSSSENETTQLFRKESSLKKPPILATNKSKSNNDTAAVMVITTPSQTNLSQSHFQPHGRREENNDSNHTNDENNIIEDNISSSSVESQYLDHVLIPSFDEIDEDFEDSQITNGKYNTDKDVSESDSDTSLEMKYILLENDSDEEEETINSPQHDSTRNSPQHSDTNDSDDSIIYVTTKHYNIFHEQEEKNSLISENHSKKSLTSHSNSHSTSKSLTSHSTSKSLTSHSTSNSKKSFSEMIQNDNHLTMNSKKSFSEMIQNNTRKSTLGEEIITLNHHPSSMNNTHLKTSVQKKPLITIPSFNNRKLSKNSSNISTSNNNMLDPTTSTSRVTTNTNTITNTITNTTNTNTTTNTTNTNTTNTIGTSNTTNITTTYKLPSVRDKRLQHESKNQQVSFSSSQRSLTSISPNFSSNAPTSRNGNHSMTSRNVNHSTIETNSRNTSMTSRNGNTSMTAVRNNHSSLISSITNHDTVMIPKTKNDHQHFIQSSEYYLRQAILEHQRNKITPPVTPSNNIHMDDSINKNHRMNQFYDMILNMEITIDEKTKLKKAELTPRDRMYMMNHLKEIPNSFKSIEEYVNIFTPHLLQECVAQIQSSINDHVTENSEDVEYIHATLKEMDQSKGNSCILYFQFMNMIKNNHQNNNNTGGKNNQKRNNHASTTLTSNGNSSNGNSSSNNNNNNNNTSSSSSSSSSSGNHSINNNNTTTTPNNNNTNNSTFSLLPPAIAWIEPVSTITTTRTTTRTTSSKTSFFCQVLENDFQTSKHLSIRFRDLISLRMSSKNQSHHHPIRVGSQWIIKKISLSTLLRQIYAVNSIGIFSKIWNVSILNHPTVTTMNSSTITPNNNNNNTTTTTPNNNNNNILLNPSCSPLCQTKQYPYSHHDLMKDDIEFCLHPIYKKHLKQTYNESQLTGIINACVNQSGDPLLQQRPSSSLQQSFKSFQPKQQEQQHLSPLPLPLPFVFIQGPPGTGKTTTIIGIISTLIQQRIERGESVGKNKILVCAPSNQAVDEILKRISEKGIVVTSSSTTTTSTPTHYNNNNTTTTHYNNNTHRNNPVITCTRLSTYYPNMVRFGIKESIHPSVEQYYIENLIKHRMNERIYSSDQSGTITSSTTTLNTTTHTTNTTNTTTHTTNTTPMNSSSSSSHVFSEMNSMNQLEFEIKQSIMKQVEIIFVTLSSSGFEFDKYFNLNINESISHIVVDECCQCVEPELLIPLCYLSPSMGGNSNNNNMGGQQNSNTNNMGGHNIQNNYNNNMGSQQHNNFQRIVLIGDPCQLPATIIGNSRDYNYSRSLMERFMNEGYPAIMLNVQHRMHPKICEFPSRCFYGGQLTSHESLKSGHNTMNSIHTNIHTNINTMNSIHTNINTNINTRINNINTNTTTTITSTTDHECNDHGWEYREILRQVKMTTTQISSRDQITMTTTTTMNDDSPPIQVYDLLYSREDRSFGGMTDQQHSTSVRNVLEAQFISYLYYKMMDIKMKLILKHLNNNNNTLLKQQQIILENFEKNIGIITPYKQQVNEIRKHIHVMIPRTRKTEKSLTHNSQTLSNSTTTTTTTDINTIDGFQGREKDVILLSCVRSEGLGFLTDYRRMNVAITRAKHCLIVVCNSKQLNTSPLWREFIAHAQRNGYYHALTQPPNDIEKVQREAQFELRKLFNSSSSTSSSSSSSRNESGSSRRNGHSRIVVGRNHDDESVIHDDRGRYELHKRKYGGDLEEEHFSGNTTFLNKKRK